MASEKKMYNMLFMGAPNVGKTTLIRGMAGEFPDNRGTVGVEHFSFRDDGIKYNIWDLSGQRRCMFVLDKIFGKIDIVVLVYNVQSTHSYTYVKYVLEKIRKLNQDVNPGSEVQVWLLATTNNFKLPVVTPAISDGIHRNLGTVMFNDHDSVLAAMNLARLDTIDLTSDTDTDIVEESVDDRIQLLDDRDSQKCLGFTCSLG